MLLKRMLSLLLAAALLAGAALAEPVFEKSEDGARTVASIEAAALLAEETAGKLELPEGARFEPWRTLTDAAGNRYYCFVEFYGDTTAFGGAVKVITDAEGRLLGVLGCAAEELPEGAVLEGISAEEAERVVLAREAGARLVEGRTQQTVLPLEREVDMDSVEEVEQRRQVWAVYTAGDDAARPYTAHYVTKGGEYLYDLPVKEPGDAASLCGYDADYAFDGMEPAPYTGTVTLADGSQTRISLELMRDAEGTYYLGNLERRIAVADCYEMLYNHGHVELASSADNADWNDKYLLAMYNYCRAYDYYAAMGWRSCDGLGTPILVLKDFCDKDHNPQDNAAYAGCYYGWQIFLASDVNDLAQSLDVLGHEFTHGVTHTVMTFNAYKNDFGAINEAVSDIEGNLCEMLTGATGDNLWLLGENAGAVIRSMSAPRDYGQPEYTWDIYYIPEVRDPTTLNDRGGVHNNSSILNNTAYRLCTEAGMTLAEARDFWFAVDCAMVPGSDYAQLRQLLPWVLENLGLERYDDGLWDAMTATVLGEDTMAENIESRSAMLTLELPDEERFTDGHWGLGVLSLDVATAYRRIRDILLQRGEYYGALDELLEALNDIPEFSGILDEDGRLDTDGLADLLVKVMEMSEDAEAEESAAVRKAVQRVQTWFREKLSDVVFLGMGFAGEDGRTVRMMTRPGLAIPVLLRLELEPNSMSVASMAAAVYFMGSWHDLSPLLDAVLQTTAGISEEDAEAEDEASDAAQDIPGLDLLGLLGGDAQTEPEPLDPDSIRETLNALEDIDLETMFNDLEKQAQSYEWLVNLLVYNIRGGAVNELSAKDIEKVTAIEGDLVKNLLNLAMQQPTA